MSRRIFQFVAALVLFFATLTPLANCFDTWDKGAAAAPANDTELHLTGLFVGVGFVLVLPKLVRHFFAPRIRAERTARPLVLSAVLFSFDHAASKPTVSPPLIPLRI